MLLLMTCVLLSVSLIQGQSNDCPLSSDVDVAGDGMLLLRHVVNQFNMTISVELEYVGIGWVGLAFSNIQTMIPNTAVIGLPNDGTVLKYDLTSRIILGVVAASADRQTLTDTSIVQNGSTTTLKFTKSLTETDEPTVGLNTNIILVAYGGSNILNYHAFSLATTATFSTLCDASASAAPFDGPVAVPVEEPLVVPLAAPDSPTIAPAAIAGEEPTTVPAGAAGVESDEPIGFPITEAVPVPSGDGYTPAATLTDFTPVKAPVPTSGGIAHPIMATLLTIIVACWQLLIPTL
jgi:hypothetical protein